ncbi:MAG: hypothetical protein EXQ96_11175 [Alphaproteobacteria bacterium]|nr:hypothetical protein [Alphaproteobacteria bacterium]
MVQFAALALLLSQGSAPERPAAKSPTGDRAHVTPSPLAAPPTAVAAPPQTEVDDTPAWRRYAVRLDGRGSGPLIAVVVDDLGPARAHALRAINLPAPLTLAFLP